MRRFFATLGIITLLSLLSSAPTLAATSGGTTNTTSSSGASSQPCPGGDFIGLPRWDAYLQGQTDPTTGQCTPVVDSLSDVWLIIAAVIEMLLRIAGIGAVVMVIYGGVRYTTSMGSAESVNQAKNTILFSIIGLVIAITAAFIVTFIAGSLGA